MASGVATLRLCRAAGFYGALYAKAVRLTDGLRAAAQEAGLPLQTDARGGMFGMALLDRPVRNFADAQACDHELFARFFRAMLERGVWLPPSGYEAMFVSSAHDDDSLSLIVEAARESFRCLVS